MLKNYFLKLYSLQKNNIVKHFFSILFLFVILILISHKVLPFDGGITYNDAAYFWNMDEGFQNIVSTYSENYLGMNQSSGMFGYASKGFLVWILKKFHINHDVISYLISFGFVFLASLVAWFVFLKITKSFFFSILAGLLIILNNISIEYIGYGGMVFHFPGVISFIFGIFIFWRCHEKKSITTRDLFGVILLSLCIMHPFYLIMYVILIFGWFLFWFFTNTFKIKFLLTRILFIFLGIGLICAYWIIPFLESFFQKRMPNEVYNNVESVFSGFLSVVSYINTMNFFQYGNFFVRNFHQTIFHYIFYIGMIILIIWLTFFIISQKKRGIFIFLLTLYLFFFFLSLGPISKLSGGLWMYFWENVPGFSFFRSFTRYQAILIPIIIFYFSLFYLEWKYIYKNRILIASILCVLLINIKMFSGNLGGSIMTTKIPEEYKKINSIVREDFSSNTIITFPNKMYEVYKWSVNDDRKLLRQAFMLRDYLFLKPYIGERASVGLQDKNDMFRGLFSDENLRNIESSFRMMNIGYVLIQKDLLDNDTGDVVEYLKYDNYFRNNNSFALLEENAYYTFYKYNKHSPILVADNLSFIKESPVEYRLILEKVNERNQLVFFQNFSSEWVLFPDNIHWKNDQKYIKNYSDLEGKSVFEYLRNGSSRELNFMEFFFKEAHFKQSHEKIYDYANQWTIDPEYIKENFPADSWKENSDGSIDVALTLYFKPQSYFYLGLLISGTTLFGCVGYLGYDFWRERRKRKKLVCDIEK